MGETVGRVTRRKKGVRVIDANEMLGSKELIDDRCV